MKISIRKIYEIENDNSKISIEFHKIQGVPGFTHRVSVNGIGKDWLSKNFKPSEKAALFYAEKHMKGGLL